MLDAPPQQPPGVPSASGMSDLMGNPAESPGLSGALPQMEFELEQDLKTLAQVVGPELAPMVDKIISQLRDVVAQYLSRGAGGTPPYGGPF